MHMYSWHFFCLFQACLFVIDIFKIYFLKNRSVNENFNSKHQMPFSNSIFMWPCIIKNRPFYSMSLDLTPQKSKVNDAFSPISSSCDISYILKISSEFHKFSQIKTVIILEYVLGLYIQNFIKNEILDSIV